MRCVVAVFALIACTSSNDGEVAKAKRCELARDHLVELRLAGTQADAEAHRAAITDALGTRFTEECVATLSRDQIDCALAAKDATRALSCIQ